jgi:hypothetical protein
MLQLPDKKEAIMKRNSALVSLGVLLTLVFVVGTSIQAGEIIYADDIRTNVITSQSLVRTADNIIVLVDTSGSMGELNKTLNKSYYELELEALTRGVSRLPDLGYNIGVYRFTPWEVLYPSSNLMKPRCWMLSAPRNPQERPLCWRADGPRLS